MSNTYLVPNTIIDSHQKVYKDENFLLLYNLNSNEEAKIRNVSDKGNNNQTDEKKKEKAGYLNV